MAKPVAKKPVGPRNQPVVNAKPLTLQEKAEKWFLPFLFVAIGGVIVWTIVKEVLGK